MMETIMDKQPLLLMILILSASSALAAADYVRPPGKTLEAELKRQVEVYRRVFEVCLENPRMKGIKLWGVVDDTDWKAKKEYHPHLFDAQGRAKPAFFAVREALANASRDARASHRSDP